MICSEKSGEKTSKEPHNFIEDTDLLQFEEFKISDMEEIVDN